ncbi:MAG: hypothetical protein ACR2Q4_19105, partial [Geminicoccaceae bacterium]
MPAEITLLQDPTGIITDADLDKVDLYPFKLEARRRRRVDGEDLKTVAEAIQEPTFGKRRINGRRPRLDPRWTAQLISRVQERALIDHWQRQPAGVHKRARKLVKFRKVEHSISKEPACVRLGRDEIGGARGVQNILIHR